MVGGRLGDEDIDFPVRGIPLGRPPIMILLIISDKAVTGWE